MLHIHIHLRHTCHSYFDSRSTDDNIFEIYAALIDFATIWWIIRPHITWTLLEEFASQS